MGRKTTVGSLILFTLGGLSTLYILSDAREKESPDGLIYQIRSDREITGER
jgi:hypothetical protein